MSRLQHTTFIANQTLQSIVLEPSKKAIEKEKGNIQKERKKFDMAKKEKWTIFFNGIASGHWKASDVNKNMQCTIRRKYSVVQHNNDVI